MATKKIVDYTDKEVDKIFKGAEEHAKGIVKEINKGGSRIAEFRREASRLASLANKRIQRLEKNDLKDNPAYKYYVESGGKFGVRGKTYNQVQAEMARLRRFVNMQSSTIKGTEKILKEIANNTGIEYKNIKQLKRQSAKFFELASKAEQYMRQVSGSGSVIGYNKIWDTINELQRKGEIDLESSKQSVESMLKRLNNALDEYQKERVVRTGGYGTSFFNMKDIK